MPYCDSADCLAIRKLPVGQEGQRTSVLQIGSRVEGFARLQQAEAPDELGARGNGFFAGCLFLQQFGLHPDIAEGCGNAGKAGVPGIPG